MYSSVFMFVEEADLPFMVVNMFIHVKVYLISKKKRKEEAIC